LICFIGELNDTVGSQIRDLLA